MYKLTAKAKSKKRIERKEEKRKKIKIGVIRWKEKGKREGKKADGRNIVGRKQNIPKKKNNAGGHVSLSKGEEGKYNKR